MRETEKEIQERERVMRLYGRTSERAGDSPVTVDGFISDSLRSFLFFFGKNRWRGFF